MEFRKAYTQKSVPARIEGESLTKQSEKDSCDVNKIINNFKRNGAFTSVNPKPGIYGDIAVSDFQDAVNTVQRAQEAFYSLPVAQRQAFDHSPAAMLDFLAKPENRDEAIRLGFIVPPPAPVVPAVQAPVVPPAKVLPAGGAAGA